MSEYQVDYGGEGKPLLFCHANGFHPSCYTTLLEPLTSQHRISAILFRPFWKNESAESFRSWKTLVDDLIIHLEKNFEQPIHALGHSMGGVVIIAAAEQRPDLFEKLVIMDPAIVPQIAYWTEWVPFSIKKKLIPIAKSANKRKDKWSDRQAIYDHLRMKRVYRAMTDKAFEDFLDHGFTPTEDGQLTLSYSKAWETKMFCSTINVWPKMPHIKTESLYIRGDRSNLMHGRVWEKMQKKSPNAQFDSIKGASHLLPLEQPEQVAKKILNFLA